MNLHRCLRVLLPVPEELISSVLSLRLRCGRIRHLLIRDYCFHPLLYSEILVSGFRKSRKHLLQRRTFLLFGVDVVPVREDISLIPKPVDDALNGLLVMGKSVPSRLQAAFFEGRLVGNHQPKKREPASDSL